MVTETLRPTSAGIYSIYDAALFIAATMPPFPESISKAHPFKLSTRHLHRWVKEGLAGKYLEGLNGDEVALTFLDLVSMRIIAICRSYGVKPKAIVQAHTSLSLLRGWNHPFAMEPLWAFSGDIFVVEAGSVFHAVTRSWQPAFEFIREYLLPTHNLTFNEYHQASKWEPEEGIQLDPEVAFGAPCLKGTRITSDTLWALHQAGDSKDQIATAYRISTDQVEAAFAWEERLDRTAE